MGTAAGAGTAAASPPLPSSAKKQLGLGGYRINPRSGGGSASSSGGGSSSAKRKQQWQQQQEGSDEDGAHEAGRRRAIDRITSISSSDRTPLEGNDAHSHYHPIDDITSMHGRSYHPRDYVTALTSLVVNEPIADLREFTAQAALRLIESMASTLAPGRPLVLLRQTHAHARVGASSQVGHSAAFASADADTHAPQEGNSGAAFSTSTNIAATAAAAGSKFASDNTLHAPLDTEAREAAAEEASRETERASVELVDACWTALIGEVTQCCVRLMHPAHTLLLDPCNATAMYYSAVTDADQPTASSSAAAAAAADAAAAPLSAVSRWLGWTSTSASSSQRHNSDSAAAASPSGPRYYSSAPTTSTAGGGGAVALPRPLLSGYSSGGRNGEDGSLLCPLPLASLSSMLYQCVTDEELPAIARITPFVLRSAMGVLQRLILAPPRVAVAVHPVWTRPSEVEVGSGGDPPPMTQVEVDGPIEGPLPLTGAAWVPVFNASLFPLLHTCAAAVSGSGCFSDRGGDSVSSSPHASGAAAAAAATRGGFNFNLEYAEHVVACTTTSARAMLSAGGALCAEPSGFAPLWVNLLRTLLGQLVLAQTRSEAQTREASAIASRLQTLLAQSHSARRPPAPLQLQLQQVQQCCEECAVALSTTCEVTTESVRNLIIAFWTDGTLDAASAATEEAAAAAEDAELGAATSFAARGMDLKAATIQCIREGYPRLLGELQPIIAPTAEPIIAHAERSSSIELMHSASAVGPESPASAPVVYAHAASSISDSGGGSNMLVSHPSRADYALPTTTASAAARENNARGFESEIVVADVAIFAESTLAEKEGEAPAAQSSRRGFFAFLSRTLMGDPDDAEGEGALSQIAE